VFTVWEIAEQDRRVAEVESLDVALDKVDVVCRLRHDDMAAAVNAGEGTYRFEIRGPSGAALATLAYAPDVTRPYMSVVVPELRTGKPG
jgi:hypothetical protein